MTFNTNRPNGNQSPALFPAQALVNWTRVKANINGDHLFNDTASATDGVHKQSTMIARAPPAVPPAAGTNGTFYCWLDANSKAQLRWYNGVTDYQMTANRILASVNFDGTGATGVDQVIRSSFNVTKVTHPSTGIYTVQFTTPMPNINYIVQVTGMRLNDPICGQVLGGGTYAGSVDVGSVKISFAALGSSASFRDVVMGNVLVIGVE